MDSVKYDASRKSLLSPGSADDFFQLGPFEDEAALCAEMARLAYVKERERLTAYLARAEFKLELALGYGRQGTQVFVARHPLKNLVVVAFRGTEPDDRKDISDDSKFLNKEVWTDHGGNLVGDVHEGFASALRRDGVLVEVARSVSALGNGNRLLLTGHSLGAALATLMATQISASCLYTFGSCRVGDAHFAKAFHTNHLRFANCCDVVTRIPPEGFGYQHTGRLMYVDRKGRVIEAPSKSVITVDRLKGEANYFLKYAFLKGTMFTRDFADHAPINYVSGVMGLRSG